MRGMASALGLCAFAAAAVAWGEPLRNPPVRDCDPGKDAECACDSGNTTLTNGCVQISLDLGRTSVLSDGRRVALKILEMEVSPSIFTPAALNVVLGYTFKYLGSDRTKRNVPQEVVFADSNGEAMTFRFAEGSSLAACTAQSSMNQLERLQMVDAEGWATVEDPAYYDLYPGDGTVWRFYATDVTGRLGELVSHTDARGKVTPLADFGVEVVRGSYGQIRQVLTPSRLADVTVEREDKYVVSVYPIVGRPEMEEGLYVVPQTAPVYVLSIEREAGDNHRLLARLKKGTGAFRDYRYRYHPDVFDWELTFPNGNVSDKAIMHGENDDATLESIQRTEDGTLLTWQKSYFEDFGWGLVKTRKKEGREEGPQRVTTWDYVMDGANQGRVASTTDWRGKTVAYAYDDRGRVTRETEAGGLRETVYDYAPVAPDDVLNAGAGVAAVVNDTRPRCEVRYEKDPETEAMVEVARTYFVYSPTQEIVERAATAGAAYGAAGALRTVRTWYAPDDARPFYAGRLASVRNEDGSLRVYDYRVEDERWIETVTALHEQAPEPVSGKTTRSATVYDRVGNVAERNQEAFIDGAWHLIDRITYEYDISGNLVKETDFAGRVTTTVWGGSCCGKTSMTLPDGTRFTYTYDGEGRLIAETKLDPLPCTTHTEYDALGRVVKTWQDGLNPETTVYDIFGQVISQTDVRGGVTQTVYSLNGRTVTTTLPNGATQIRKTDALGRLLELSGTAVQPQVFTYGPLWERVATGARWQRTERNLLGQSVRQTRSGANGATLETLAAYDGYGRTSQISTMGQPTQTFAYAATGEQVALTQAVGEVWRKQTTETDYLLREGEVWQRQATTQSCSDADIAPLTQQTLTRLSGLSLECSFESESVCPRGNITRTYGTDAERVTVYPSRTNPEIVCYAFGDLVETVDSACVTNRFEVDALGRQIATVDGRGNRTTYAYDAKNNLVSTTDAVSATTSYGYDVMGQTIAVTNALGNVTVYEYDLRGNKTYEGGATYPVRYTYDAFGNRTSMTTYRDEASGVGDTTTWAYDEASGVLLSKTYADGKGLTYTYTNDGKLATRTNARGIVTTYTYDDWGQLLAIDYADATPNIAYTYDAMTFTYDAFGQLLSEQVSGLYAKTLTRHYDAFGRNVGYSVDNERKQSIVYDSATGYISESDGFRWTYLPGTNLKSSLTYPNEDVVTWSYEPHRDFLTAVTNATYSTYVYTNDLLGRRTSENGEQYSYNIRDELVAADDVSYHYDDIGNRITAEGKTYTANNLNQYTAIDDFTPEYDADGNQTLIKTETGIWSVTYNAENRPVRWQSGDTVITMSFDRMGRRVEMRTQSADSDLLQRFVYDNYLCIQHLRGADNILFQSYVWDPTEPIATRPLVFQPAATPPPSYYFHDGNKNVSDLVNIQGSAAQYDYSPFGSITVSNNVLISKSEQGGLFGFSSECYDNLLGLIYYNYRHYQKETGRWISRDPLENMGVFKSFLKGDSFSEVDLYCFVRNRVPNSIDLLGLTTAEECELLYDRCCDTCRELGRKGQKYRAALCYSECMAVQAACLAKCAMEYSWEKVSDFLDWARTHPTEVVIGSLVVIGGVTYMISTGPVGGSIILIAI